eukprot:TRINITY_DN649_c0_g1_i1.p1 TRINITY_DN649_c0_g1~~TRINITY_DN649_c0_g1_i1.p1  ORF type:complete len:287 (-),score=79.76 TRINITY_DN649_c0_g1_i1:418-1278(-)
MVGLSHGEKVFIQGGIAQDLRSDGRGRQHFRPFAIETGVIPQAHGSARVKLGSTDVIATVKADLGKPSTTHANMGKIDVFVECSSTADPEFERRGGDTLAQELAEALQRCLFGGKNGAGSALDMSSLTVIEGKVCWNLCIDGLVVSSDGNLLDALGIAMKAALSNTAIPKVEAPSGVASEYDINISEDEFTCMDVTNLPLIVTLTKVGKHYIVDATSQEESQMSSAVSVSVNRKGSVCGLTKRGAAGIDPSVILDMISVAKHVGQLLMTQVDSEIAAAESRMAEDA